MDSVLPNSFHFKALFFCLSIPPFKASNIKLLVIITTNLILLLTEVIIQYTLRKAVFAFSGKPVLMVLDSVAIIGPLLVHALLILESLAKMRTDSTIWGLIGDLNDRLNVLRSILLDKVFYRDFVLLTVVPPAFQFAVILATYQTQGNWAMGLICRQFSCVINRWGIIAFVYYLRYMSECLTLMGQEVRQILDMPIANRGSGYFIVRKLQQIRTDFNLVWRLHGFVKNRYEAFLVSYFFWSLCGITAAMYFLGTRLVTRRFPYTLESALCIGPFLYTKIHISVVAANFVLKQARLLNDLEVLSVRCWDNSQVISAVKSLKIQMKLANLSPTVGGHLQLEYSSMVQGVIYIGTTYIFIFLFLN